MAENNNGAPGLTAFSTEEDANKESVERIKPMLANAFTDTPIAPTSIRAIRETFDPRDYPGDSTNVPTAHVSVMSEFFVVLRELARMILTGTEWSKKARIVLEYDPQIEKMEIKTFMSRDEAAPTADRQSFLD